MRRVLLPSAIALAFALCVGAVPAGAQAPPMCPPGYYLATDGLCYPARPIYAPPVYEAAPVYQPPIIFDGFSVGIGIGIGGGGYYGGYHGGRDRGRDRERRH